MSITIPQMKTIAALNGSDTYVDAGHKLGKSGVAVGKQVRLIEDELSRTLVLRSSTKRLSLTEFGVQLAERYSKILQEMDDVNHWATHKDDSTSGTVRIAYHDDEIFNDTITPLLKDFCNKHPGIDIHLQQLNPEIKQAGFKPDIYWGMSEYFKIQNQRITARKLFNISIGIYASPIYLKKFGEPKTLKELNDHQLITSYFRLPNDKLFYFDKNSNEKVSNMPLRTHIRTTNNLLEFAIDGLGIINTGATLSGTYEAVQNWPASANIKRLLGKKY